MPYEINETILRIVGLADNLKIQYDNPKSLLKQLKMNNNNVLVIKKKTL